jgi:hypothetical protein
MSVQILYALHSSSVIPILKRMEELCFLALARTEEHLTNFSKSADLELGQLVYQGTTS